MQSIAAEAGVNLVDMLSYYPGEGYDPAFLDGVAVEAVNVTLYEIFVKATKAAGYDFDTLTGLQNVRDVNKRAVSTINHFVTTTTSNTVYDDNDFKDSVGEGVTIDPASLQFIDAPISSIIPNLQSDELYVYRIAKARAAQ